MTDTVIDIPHFAVLHLRHVVLDYNGTLAKDGVLKDEVKALLEPLIAKYRVHVITSDTFGSVASQLKAFDVHINVLKSEDHTAEKAAYLQSLDASTCVAIGNGANDSQMLREALLGIALMGDEGCATQTLLSSRITCKHIKEALELLLYEKRLIATLRA
jgi:soluble P-type ATPase